MSRHLHLWPALVCLVAASAPMQFVCREAAGPIVVDGKADDAAWDAVEPITEYFLTGSLAPPTETTSLKTCYDDKSVYFLYECSDKDVFALHDERDTALWESDVVEVFFWPDEERPIYYEFEIAPNNVVFDARYVNTGSGHWRRWCQWDSGIRSAATVHGTLNDWRDRDEGFTVEFAIPIAAFADVNGDKPLKGQTWRFAGVRFNYSTDLKSPEGAVTSQDPRSDLHQYRGFAQLMFE